MTAKTSDPLATHLTQEIVEASAALVDLCKSQPDRDWPAYELKTQARNGWSAGAMSMALSRLLDEGVLWAEGDRIRLSE